MSNSKKRMLLFSIIVLILIVALIISILYVFSNRIKVNWSLYGHALSPEGTVTETVEFTFSGTIIDYDSMKMAVTSFPYDPPYTLLDRTDFYTAWGNTAKSPYYGFSFYYFDEKTGALSGGKGGIDLEGETVVFLMDNDICLAASTDPDADPQEILAFFDGLID